MHLSTTLPHHQQDSRHLNINKYGVRGTTLKQNKLLMLNINFMMSASDRTDILERVNVPPLRWTLTMLERNNFVKECFLDPYPVYKKTMVTESSVVKGEDEIKSICLMKKEQKMLKKNKKFFCRTLFCLSILGNLLNPWV